MFENDESLRLVAGHYDELSIAAGLKRRDDNSSECDFQCCRSWAVTTDYLSKAQSKRARIPSCIAWLLMTIALSAGAISYFSGQSPAQAIRHPQDSPLVQIQNADRESPGEPIATLPRGARWMIGTSQFCPRIAVKTVVVPRNADIVIAAGGRLHGMPRENRTVNSAIQVWKLKDGTECGWIEIPNRGIRSIAVTADGSMLVASTDRGEICVYELQKQRRVRTIEMKDVVGVDVSDDGDRILGWTSDWTTTVFDRRAKLVSSIEVPDDVRKRELVHAAISAAGDRVALAAKGQGVLVVHLETNSLEAQFDESSVRHVKYSADGKLLGLVTQSGLGAVYKVDDKKLVARSALGGPLNPSVFALDCGEQSAVFAMANSYFKAYSLDVDQSHELIDATRNAVGQFGAAAVRVRDNLVVIAPMTKHIRPIRFDKKRQVPGPIVEEQLRSAYLALEYNVLLHLDKSGRVIVRDLRSGAITKVLTPTTDRATGRASEISFSPVVFTAGGKYVLGRLDDGTHTIVDVEGGLATRLVVDVAHDLVASATANAVLLGIHNGTKHKVACFAKRGSAENYVMKCEFAMEERISHAAISDDGRLVFACDESGIGVVWDVRKSSKVVRADLKQVLATSQLTLATDGSFRFLPGGLDIVGEAFADKSDRRVRFVLRSEDLTVRPLTQMTTWSEAWSACFSSNGQIVAICDRDDRIRLVEPFSGMVLHDFSAPHAAFVRAVSDDFSLVIAEDFAGNITCWETNAGDGTMADQSPDLLAEALFSTDASKVRQSYWALHALLRTSPDATLPAVVKALKARCPKVAEFPDELLRLGSDVFREREAAMYRLAELALFEPCATQLRNHATANTTDEVGRRVLQSLSMRAIQRDSIRAIRLLVTLPPPLRLSAFKLLQSQIPDGVYLGMLFSADEYADSVRRNVLREHESARQCDELPSLHPHTGTGRIGGRRLVAGSVSRRSLLPRASVIPCFDVL